MECVIKIMVFVFVILYLARWKLVPLPLFGIFGSSQKHDKDEREIFGTRDTAKSKAIHTSLSSSLSLSSIYGLSNTKSLFLRVYSGSWKPSDKERRETIIHHCQCLQRFFERNPQVMDPRETSLCQNISRIVLDEEEYSKSMLYGSAFMIFGMSKNMYDKWSFDHTQLKMAWIQHQSQQKDGYMSYPPPVLPSSSSSTYFDASHKESMSSSSPSSSSSGARISPAVLFIIVILAILFFISGLLHLLVRFLIKNPSSTASAQSNRPQEISTTDALQRQLQQLFHLHDSGLDQAFIDALPVFQYKEIKGPKEPFDCAVCLCEFSEKDKLRLLPMCSHAFHINCIDTWLLSNSTCPLCRGTLLTPGFSIENPIFDFDDLREDQGCPCNGENGFTTRQKTVEIEETVEKGVFPVRLGKFRRLDVESIEAGGGETSSSNLDARRCYSMGSYQYVLGNSDLRIALNHHRQGCDAKLAKGAENLENISVEGDMEAKNIRSVSKGESYSVSKIWLWSKKGKFSVSSDAEMGMPSSLYTDLPWMRETEGT